MLLALPALTQGLVALASGAYIALDVMMMPCECCGREPLATLGASVRLALRFELFHTSFAHRVLLVLAPLPFKEILLQLDFCFSTTSGGRRHEAAGL